MNGWLAKEKNRWFQPSTGVALQKITDMRWLEITIGIPHNAYVLLDLVRRACPYSVGVCRNWQYVL